MISYIYATVVVSYYLLVKELVTRKLKFQVFTPSFFAKNFWHIFSSIVNKRFCKTLEKFLSLAKNKCQFFPAVYPKIE